METAVPRETMPPEATYQQIAEDLQNKQTAIEYAFKAKSEFLATISHEIRSPLMAILGYADLMYDAKQTVSERLRCIGRIRENAKHLSELIQDVLDLSLIEAHSLTLESITGHL